MPLTDIAKLATCTTCHFDQDFSNYWTANVYYRSPKNGTYRRVPQIANQFNEGDNAGITVYYTSPGPKLTTAFKPVGKLHVTVGISHLGLTGIIKRASAC